MFERRDLAGALRANQEQKLPRFGRGLVTSRTLHFGYKIEGGIEGRLNRGQNKNWVVKERSEGYGFQD